MPESDFTPRQLASIEQATQTIGRRLLDSMPRVKARPWQRRWWDDRLMQWALRDEAVKLPMFRLVDVLPMLSGGGDLGRGLQEYLGPVADKLPLAARWGLKFARPDSPLTPLVAWATRFGARGNARRFIAGVDLTQVLASAWRERRKGRAFTLDILGEAVASEAEADRYFQAYLELIEKAAPVVNAWPDDPRVDPQDERDSPRLQVSVKLSALDSQFDAIDFAGTLQRVGHRLRELLRAARRCHAYVHVDMESYAAKDLTLAIFQHVLAEPEFSDFADVGIVLQCYLKDSAADARALFAWAQRRGAPVWVRLVKGAYWDYETVHAQAALWPVPVFQHKRETDANYEAVTRFLLQRSDVLRPALASHNLRSLAHGMAVAEQLGLSPRGFEIQMLYGMADPEKDALVAEGQRLRVYMPFGELIPGMAYLVRRLLENTSNDSFLRDNFERHAPAEVLLRNPAAGPTSLTSERQARAPESLSLSLSLSQSQSQSPGQPAPLSSITLQSGAVMQSVFRNEPAADFSRVENRNAMSRALVDVAEQFGQHYSLVIAGRNVESASGQSARVANPSRYSQALGSVAQGSAENAADAVRAAAQALGAWHGLGAERRAALLRAAADRLLVRRWELAAWIIYECGKPWREADGDVCEAIDFLRYYADGAVLLERGGHVHVPGEENDLRYLPRGVTAVIAPWNFPLAILTGMTAAALATGNTVVMKPSEQSSIVAAKLMQVFQEAGLPAGVVNYLPGAGQVVGAALVDHPSVAVVAFTGSRAVGLAINRRAAEVSQQPTARMVKRVIAEMGGKNAVIVDDNADLDEAVSGVVHSAFGYSGQKCSACSRAIVLNKVYDTFLARLVEAARSLKVGPADEPGTTVGPVIDAESQARVRRYIEIGRRTCREALSVDVGPLAAQGYFVGPHIFAEVNPASPLAQEEIFGPVLAVLRVATLEDAIAAANDVDYALTGGIFSRSPANLDLARRTFNVGNLYLNRGITGALVGRQPFGGFKMSGIGSKAGGPDYLLQFVNPRTITENTLRRGFAPADQAEGETRAM